MLFIRNRNPDADSGANCILPIGWEEASNALRTRSASQIASCLSRIWEKTRELLTSDPAKKIIWSQMRSRQPTE